MPGLKFVITTSDSAASSRNVSRPSGLRMSIVMLRFPRLQPMK